MTTPAPGLLLILSGPAGAGKTTLARRLCEADPACVLSVSATTRPPRGNERDGADYFFLSRPAFEERVARGEFAEHAEFSGQLYGTPRSFLDERLARGITVVLDIEVKGAAQLRSHYPRAVTVFLLPPSPAVLVQRLKGRKTDSPAEIARRMEIARHEVLQLESYNYFLVNDDPEEAFHSLCAICRAERHRVRGGEVERWLGGRTPEEVLKADAHA